MAKDYKDTLIMPQTEFEMRGNLTKKEPKFNEFWVKNEIFKKWNEGKTDTFNLHDGPPYANGSIHVGHSLNKILKDFIIKYQSMTGKKTNWTIGWDTHGLPIEVAIQKKGFSVKEMPVLDYLDKAREYALEQVETQKNQFKSLSLSADFDSVYKTLDKEFEAKQLEVFAKMFQDGLIYQDLKPIYWSWSSETALAEAEIEYKDVTSPSIYVPFKVKEANGNIEEDYKFVIWTTTPWTLPANVGIALGEKIEYSVLNTEKGKFIVATELIDSFKTATEVEIIDSKVLGTGKEIAALDLIAINPLIGTDSKIIIAKHVTTEAGVGLVHIAGGHGEDDFIAAKDNGLEIFTVLDERGIMINASDDWNGKFYLKAQKEIVSVLEEKGNLIKHIDIKHSYPHDWRTKKPVVFRATKQWFASIDKIRPGLIAASDSIEWIPEWGKQKSSKMIENRGDWCISRQRYWGFPLPIIYNVDGTPISSPEFFDHIGKLIAEHGTRIWFEKDIKDLLPSSIKFEEGMRKEKDTMDVWFDSGSSWNGVVNSRKQPDIDIYLEGSDQYRGWFASSLITSFATTGKPMTKKILSHGFVLDEKGNKMSKSIGNTIDPLKVTTTLGADILRLWVSTVDYKNDVRIGNNILKQTSETYRKLRNTIKFILGNLNDFNAEENYIENVEGVHSYIMDKLSKLILEIKESYEEFNFSKVVDLVSLFFINDLSSFYFDYAKDILYTREIDNIDRRSIQTVMFEIMDKLVPYLAPIIPTTIEESYSHFNKKNKKESIFLEELKTLKTSFKEEKLWEDFFKIRSVVNKSIEDARNAGELKRSLEAEVKLTLDEDISNVEILNLSELLVVARISVSRGKETTATAKNINGVKCQRCWKFFKQEEINKDDICQVCQDVVDSQKS